MSAKTVIRVPMACNGCANALRGALVKVPGVQTVDADVAAQHVVITGTASEDHLLTAIRNAGKQATLVK